MKGVPLGTVTFTADFDAVKLTGDRNDHSGRDLIAQYHLITLMVSMLLLHVPYHLP